MRCGVNIQISEEIKNLIPYKPGKPLSEAQREYGIDDFVKLASNECPIPPSQNILEAISKAASEINRYPDPSCFDLRKVASKYYKAPEEKFVFGNGSNELIDLLIRGFCQPGDSILTPKYSFVAYRICAQAVGVKTVETELKNGFQVDLDAISKQIENAWNCPKLVFIPNPNNPTGTYINKTELDAFLNKWKHREDFLIVFDEAYTEFVRAKDYPFGLASSPYKNVVVLKTLSKVFALAGLRVGSMIADPFVIDIVNRIRNPFNVNSLAQAAAIAAIQDTAFLDQIKKITWDGLDYFYSEFDKMGLEYTPSQANFVLINTVQDASLVNEKLLKKGVILRPVANYGMPQHLRVSVGLPFENEKAVNALKMVL